MAVIMGFHRILDAKGMIITVRMCTHVYGHAFLSTNGAFNCRVLFI